MKIEEIIKLLEQEEDFILRYREKGIKVYFLGQKIFDIEKDKIKLPETLKVSGLKWKKEKYQEYIKKVKSLETYASYFSLTCPTVDFCFSTTQVDLKKVSFSIEACMQKLRELSLPFNPILFSSCVQERRKYTLFPHAMDIATILHLQQELFSVTIGKPPFKKPQFSILFYLSYEKINTELFLEIMNVFKKLISLYNHTFVLGEEEKMFQQFMMKQEIISKIEEGLLPYEEEFVIYPNYKRVGENRRMFDKEGCIYLKEVASESAGQGRIDNVYINKNGELTFVEIKVDEGVISFSKNGILKHLDDLYQVYQNEAEKKRIYTVLEQSIKKKNASLQTNFTLNKEKFHYYILCGYTSVEKKKKIEDLLKEDLQKFKETIIKDYEAIREEVTIKLFFVEAKKDEEGKYKEIMHVEDKTALLTVNK